MTSYLDKLNLRPFEKRLVIGVLILFVIVLNAVFVWPHFKDWGDTKERLTGLQQKLQMWQEAIKQKGEFERKVKTFEAEGAAGVSAEDQANQFLRTVQNQAAVSGVTILGISRQSTQTNAFFLEQLQTFQVQAGEAQLVDFLFTLGSGDSIIRARGLSLRPNPPRQLLAGSIDLVASYQKNSTAKNSTAKKP